MRNDVLETQSSKYFLMTTSDAVYAILVVCQLQRMIFKDKYYSAATVQSSLRGERSGEVVQ